MDTVSVEITKVNAGPETGKPYDSKRGKVYPIEFMCDVKEEGTTHTGVKVSIPAQKTGTHPLEDIILNNGTVKCWPAREYQGQRQYNIAVNDSKELNDLGGGNYNGGGTSGGSSYSSVGAEVGAAMHDACALVAAAIPDSDADIFKLVHKYAKMCLKIADELKAEREGKHTSSSTQTEQPELSFPEKLTAAKKMLTPELIPLLSAKPPEEAKGLCVSAYEDSNGNPDEFVNILTDALGQDELPF